MKKGKLFRLTDKSEKELIELKGYLNLKSQNDVIEAAIKNLYDQSISSDYLLQQHDKMDMILFGQISMLLKNQMNHIAMMMNQINKNQTVTSILLEMCLLSIADISDKDIAKKNIASSLKYTEKVKLLLEKENA